MLVALARDNTLRIRDLAGMVGVTERAVAQILIDLEGTGVIAKSKDGRRNSYEVNIDAQLRHPLEHHRTVRDIIRLAERE